MKIILYIVVCIFLLSLVPSIVGTYRLIEDAHGLVTVAGLNSDEITVNPYSNNSLFFTPQMAVWVLESFDYPYENCSDSNQRIDICSAPLIQWAGRGIDLNGNESDERLYHLINVFISRGLPINSIHEGSTSVHEAILFNNARLLSMLLANGGDASIKMVKPGSKYHGLNAYQFLEVLKLKNKRDTTEVEKVLLRYKENA
ncbi:hypothetical protein [Marinobacter sp. CHS3-4]|uniref:hypothetical protein n=1 Tax=Marinobacter sp. CHS3-4 TaxID=3045174 RepID=UPI0024B54779|nr:hypothetical protein [Marinobacter sp. CHS3-4]MDI9245181.1 hypothetical protein [Marinobacter sp. CHS3-4]